MQVYSIYKVRALKPNILSNGGITPNININTNDVGTFQKIFSLIFPSNPLQRLAEARFNGQIIRINYTGDNLSGDDLYRALIKDNQFRVLSVASSIPRDRKNIFTNIDGYDYSELLK